MPTTRRYPRVDDLAARRADARRGRALGRGNFPYAEEAPEGWRAQHQCWRRGRLRTEPQIGRRGADLRGRAIEKAGYKPGEHVAIALDPASTEFFANGKYELKGEGKSHDSARWSISMPISWRVSDHLHRGRHGRGRLGRLEGLTKELGGKIQLVGDDLFVTNPKRLAKGIEDHAANASSSR